MKTSYGQVFINDFAEGANDLCTLNKFVFSKKGTKFEKGLARKRAF